MTDRGRSALQLSEHQMRVGPSALRWTKRGLEIDINEVGAPPIVAPVRGKVVFEPSAVTDREMTLTDDGAHVWRPFAPVGGIRVDLESKGWQWSGHGYFDANFGTRALEEDFSYWTWGRFPTSDGATCFYDAQRLDGSAMARSVAFGTDGSAREAPLLPKALLPRSLWAVARETRADAGYRPKQVLSMLDAPFYSRAMVQTKLDGEESVGVYEALDLVRFRSPLLRPMLAVRVPRRPRWRF